ncbi:hypothetical protein ACQJBY_031845 [Aegilops geniculata]
MQPTISQPILFANRLGANNLTFFYLLIGSDWFQAVLIFPLSRDSDQEAKWEVHRCGARSAATTSFSGVPLHRRRFSRKSGANEEEEDQERIPGCPRSCSSRRGGTMGREWTGRVEPPLAMSWLI